MNYIHNTHYTHTQPLSNLSLSLSLYLDMYIYNSSWPTDSLSWQDFRGKVLGPTNPMEALKESIRHQILDQYIKN